MNKLNFSNRILRCLNAADINTIAELTQLSREDLCRFRHLGAKSIQEIECKLKTLGYSLRKEL